MLCMTSTLFPFPLPLMTPTKLYFSYEGERYEKTRIVRHQYYEKNLTNIHTKMNSTAIIRGAKIN